jgi:PEGA domain
MYRVFVIVVGGLALAACSSDTQWLNVDAFKPAPTLETVQFESEPPGAQVKVSNGQTCQTPCALAIPHPQSGGYDVTITLNGYLPDTEQIQLTSMGDNTSQLRPNPVLAQLTPAPPPPKARKKIVRKKRVAKPAVKKPKPAAKKPKPKPAAKPASAPTAPPPMQPQPQQAPSPWPPAEPQPR